MLNLGLYYKYHNINTNLIKPLFLIGAENEDLVTCVELSKVLIEENEYDEAANYLRYASNQNSAYAQHNLAQLYERQLKFEDAKYWYKEALKNGSVQSSINLAKLYFKEYVDNNSPIKNSYLLYAINVLNDYIDLLDKEDKKVANKLLNEYKKLVN